MSDYRISHPIKNLLADLRLRLYHLREKGELLHQEGFGQISEVLGQLEAETAATIGEVVAIDFMKAIPDDVDLAEFFKRKVDCYLGDGLMMRNVISTWASRFAFGNEANKSCWLDIEDLELVLNNLLKKGESE